MFPYAGQVIGGVGEIDFSLVDSDKVDGNSVTLGAADADRQIWMCFAAITAPSSMTLAGVTGVQVDVMNGFSVWKIYIYRFAIPTGTSGTLTIGGGTGNAAAFYRVVGGDTVAKITQKTSNNATWSLTPNNTQEKIIISGVRSTSSGTGQVGWTLDSTSTIAFGGHKDPVVAGSNSMTYTAATSVYTLAISLGVP